MKILITGIHGLIGGLLKQGLADTANIYGTDIKSSREEKVFVCDISNFSGLKEVFEKLPPIDYIIHLAADPRPEAPWESILKNNIMGTHNVYECARIFSVPRIIFASSNKATGMYEGKPPTLHLQDNPRMITVNDPISPDGDYGTSKTYGEAVAKQYCNLYAISSVCLRIGSVLTNDNPRSNARWMKTWLSHRDLVQLFKRSLNMSVPFGIYYGVSDNSGKFWDISNAKKDFGYAPEDDAAKLL